MQCMTRCWQSIGPVPISQAGQKHSELYNNNEEHHRDTTYYNLVLRYNLKNYILTPSYTKLCLDGVFIVIILCTQRDGLYSIKILNCAWKAERV
jgi:hypothetical protein